MPVAVLDDDERRRVAAAIRKYIDTSCGGSRKQFAFKAGVSTSLLDKLLTGEFTSKALARIEANVGERFGSDYIVRRVTESRLGGYSYDDVRHYEGSYQFIRPSFSTSGLIHSYAMQIEWSKQENCLLVQHRGVPGTEFRQVGVIAIPKASGQVFLVSGDDGWHQLCIFSPLTYRKTLFGCICASANTMAAIYSPVVAPAVMVQTEDPVSRKVTESDGDYSTFRDLLERVRAEGYLKVF